jgi:hypothetical protein
MSVLRLTVAASTLMVGAAACTGSSDATSPSSSGTPTPTASVTSGSAAPSSAAVQELVGADRAVTMPAVPRAHQKTRVTLSGEAPSGRHLAIISTSTGDGRISQASASCVASPSPVSQEVEPFRLSFSYTWRKPGTYDVRLTLGGLCSDMQNHKVRFELTVRPPVAAR